MEDGAVLLASIESVGAIDLGPMTGKVTRLLRPVAGCLQADRVYPRQELPAAIEIDVTLVAQLVRQQFPQWLDLPVAAVPEQGWDNRTFRLGEELSVRVPSADGYVPGLLREQATLSLLSPQIEIDVPQVVASGVASPLLGRPWSVRAWIPGHTLGSVNPRDRATALSGIVGALGALQNCDTDGGPWAGQASAYRGCHVSILGEDVQHGIETVRADLAEPLRCLWQLANATVRSKAPTWVHGDVAPGNVLFGDGGQIAALIDFGQSCIGDPACDLAFFWLSCTQAERDKLYQQLSPDDGTWLRGAVWGLWKALISSEGDLLTKYGRDQTRILEDLATFGDARL